MSDKLSSPRDLFLHLLAEILWVERMLVFEVLPSLRKQVQSESLAAAVEEHLAQTRGHVTRVEEAFRALGAEPVSARSAPAAALASEHEETAGKIAEPRLADQQRQLGRQRGAAVHGPLDGVDEVVQVHVGLAVRGLAREQAGG